MIYIFITSLLYLLLIMIVFFSKKRVNNFDNKIYSAILLVNTFGILLDILQYSIIKMEISSLVILIVCKIFLMYILSWTCLFTTYILSLSKEDKLRKKLDIIKYAVLIIGVLGILILPIEYANKGNEIYTTGLATSVVYAGVVLNIFIMLFSCIRNLKNNRGAFNKYIPLLLFLLLGTISTIIQYFNPAMLLTSPCEVFVTILTFFFIENPDIKMLNEMYKNKELMEQGYEDKYNFLFEMTQEARNPLVNISNLSNALRMEDNPQKVKDGLLTLNNMVRQLDFSINNILNISSLDVQKLKIVNNKYDLEKLCADLETRIKPEIKPTVKFNLSMPKQMPIFYGDYMKIRQILYSLLVNACKNTENGNINMKVNLIEKYDIARLIFNISDTGSGMPIDKINEILSSTGSLDKNELENLEKKEFNVKVCQKVVKIMGGNLMIKSNIGEGTEVILTIDQRVYHEKDTSILNQYENAIANYRKVLIVSQNKNVLNIIKKKLTDHQITYSSLYSGADAIDRLKSGKKFDFIIVDDEMKEMSGFMTMKGMQKLEGFKTPIIIMLDEDKEHIKEHYLEDGFKDYILISNIDSDLNRIIEKY